MRSNRAPETPRFISFRDLSGSEIRIRGRFIEAVLESTGAQRASVREFLRARQLEDRADRDAWETTRSES